MYRFSRLPTPGGHWATVENVLLAAPWAAEGGNSRQPSWNYFTYLILQCCRRRHYGCVRVWAH